ncbi:MAG TPA: ATP-binding protein, partial [Longimicrobiales bacterium]|nr:ATP-binding protein [Longimicrobiales bacterium]
SMKVPFHVGGVVSGAWFTDRAAEVARITTALREPPHRLLVYGPRRMGKTSAIHAAVRRAERSGTRVVVADLSTVSTAADAANRIAAAAAHALGRRWKDLVAEFVANVGLRLSLHQEPGGLLVPSLELALRRAPHADQMDALGRTLDALNALAAAQDAKLAIVLDEFQELNRLGGTEGEWQLRGRIQHHSALSYVLAGSQEHLIRRMLEKDRAFYGMFDVLRFDAMDERHLARWIDERMTGAGVAAGGTGALIVRLAGPRTHDVMQLARRTFEVAQPQGRATAPSVGDALEQIVHAESDLIHTVWDGLTPLQQNVLRAVAAAAEGLTTTHTIERFALASTGSATNAAKALVERDILRRADTPTGYAFDSPFVHAWVLINTLPDLGLHPPLPWRT